MSGPLGRLWSLNPNRQFERLTINLAGTTHVAGYPDAILRLTDLAKGLRDRTTPGLPLVLNRDLFNEHDRNAIYVVAPMPNGRLGWIPRAAAKRVAPIMDQGRTVRAFYLGTLHKPGSDGYGVQVELRWER